jgi:hypothetical protein
MKRAHLTFPAVACVALATLLAGHASADFILRIDDYTGSSNGALVLPNGQIENIWNHGGENVDFSLTLPGGFTATVGAALAANFLEPSTGALSDTFHVTMVAGSGQADGGIGENEFAPPLVPLPDPALTIIENGQYQSIGKIALSNGEFLDAQLRSEVDAVPVPEPSTLVVSSILFCIFGVAWSHKRRKHTTPA